MKKVFLLIASFISISLIAQENVEWRGKDRAGIYNEPGLLESWPESGPELMWSYEGLGEGHSSVAIDSEKIYITGMSDGKGTIFVFDMSGKLLNKRVYGAEWNESYDGTRGTVTINDGNIYLISGFGVLYCLNQANLSTVWQKDLLKEYKAPNIRWGITESPLIVDNKVIATPGGETDNIIALNKKTGELIWSTPGEGDQSAYCSPLFIADQEVPLIVTMTANHVIGVHAETGVKLWSFENTNKYSVHANTPVYSNNMILCSSGYGKGSTMLRLNNGGRGVEKVWFSEAIDNRMGAMVKVGDYAYGSGNDSRFWFCVDWNTGEIKWQERGLANGNIIANNNMLYCYTERGKIFLVKANPEKMDIVSSFDITLGTNQHWAHPVIHKGVLYVRHGDALMAYKVK
jgi:outer membrane protein assembly factor BamB